MWLLLAPGCLFEHCQHFDDSIHCCKHPLLLLLLRVLYML
jgi:hypothetical protein